MDRAGTCTHNTEWYETQSKSLVEDSPSLMMQDRERALAARMGRIVCLTADDLLLLHNRVGHASWSRLLKMCRKGATDGIGDISGMPADELKKAEEARHTVQCMYLW